MSVYILPAPTSGDRVDEYCKLVVDTATAQVMSESAYAIANEADVSVSRFNDVQGPALDWVQSVIHSTCERIRELNVWETMPYFDADDVIGGDDADWVDVLAELSDTVQDADTYPNGWHETADSAVPVYTHDRMVTFVDTLAYREDVDDYGDMTDPVDVAGVALHMQAERICQSTATEVAAVIRSAIQEG